jgi:NAD+ synthase
VNAALAFDPVPTTAAICDRLRDQLTTHLRRRGLVVAMSGGVDSSVCAALAVRAVGADRVLGLLLPERESDPESLTLSRAWGEALGVELAVEDIAPILDAFGCYWRRNQAIRRVLPEFEDDWRCKVVLASMDSGQLSVPYIAVEFPDGTLRRIRLPAAEYRQIVAATNFKQRTRKTIEYYHADRLHYAVLGTPNRLEYDQGFFVKGGDGLADVKPIAHLYKTQVYALAEYLGVPASIRERVPTTDTYSLPQTQEEFYFGLPTEVLDVVLLAHNQGRNCDAVAAELGRDARAVARAFRDIERKRAATRYLHLPPLLAGPVPEAPSPVSVEPD